MNINEEHVSAVSFGGGGRCGTGRHIPVAEFYRGKNIERWMGSSIGGFIALLMANGFSEKEMIDAMYKLWRPTLRTAIKALAPKLINPLNVVRGKESELQKVVSTFGLLDQIGHIEKWCKGLEWKNAQFGLLDLTNGQHTVVDKDTGMPLHLALSATMAVPGVFSPVVWVDPAGKRHVFVDGGIKHCHPTVEGHKTAVVKCMSFPGRDLIWPDSEGDVIVDIGAVPGVDVLFPPSRRAIDDQVQEARTKLGIIFPAK